MEHINELGRKKFKSLFMPIQIGNIEIPNRLFWPPWCFNWANTDGTVSEKLADFYLDLADGGCGLIITGCTAVSPDSLLYERSMKLYHKDHIPGLKKLCAEIKKRGSIPGIQLMNFGRQSVTTFSGKELYAPSNIPCPVKTKKDPNYRLREMTLEDIKRVRNDYIYAAVLAIEAGVEVIQIHAAHGFLLNQFLSPYTNKRTDQYGGNVENRTRFIIEIIKGIKEEIGQAAAIDIRVSADELVDGGLKPHDYKDILPLFETAGVDMVNVSASISETTGLMFRQSVEPQGRYAWMAKELKTYTNLKIAHAAFIASLKVANKVILENNLDMVGLGRAQFADPHLIKKTVESKENEINKCAWDHSCLFSFVNNNDNQVFCLVNPKYQKKPKNL
jgi:2,4-dienoyl-CoA reductase-like NADH-dependent reductase (Old Yellow Enzyme family)